MTDGEMLKFMKDEIARQLNVILSGRAQDSAKHTETINNMYPGMPGITGRPIMRPFGIMSLAPDNTTQVVGRMGTHVGNRLVLGHRDQNAPDPGEKGETIVYSLGKYQVRVQNGSVVVGKDGQYENLVVGDTLKELLIALIDHIIAHTHLGNLGAETGPPLNAADFTQDKANFVENDKILSKDGGRF